MEFLLLLSAFLSALTGAITGTRPPEVPLHQTAIEARASVAAPRTAHVAAPVILQALPSLEAVASFGVRTESAVVDRIPLYATRRRE